MSADGGSCRILEGGDFTLDSWCSSLNGHPCTPRALSSAHAGCANVIATASAAAPVKRSAVVPKEGAASVDDVANATTLCSSDRCPRHTPAGARLQVDSRDRDPWQRLAENWETAAEGAHIERARGRVIGTRFTRGINSLALRSLRDMVATPLPYSPRKQ